nr:MAG TPA: hypothetical protein [Caudoviricetes sp.]DAV24709.1 MAG TPA: hypothetical protein [Caudoviricetes sp.]
MMSLKPYMLNYVSTYFCKIRSDCSFFEQL